MIKLARFMGILLILLVIGLAIFIGIQRVLLVIGLTILIGILFLLLVLRLGLIVVQYDAAGFCVKVRIGPVRIRIYPRPTKDEPEEADNDKLDERESKKGGAVDELKETLSMRGSIFAQLKQRLVIEELTLHYTASTDDAAKTALAYGGAHVAVSTLLPIIRQNFKVKRQDVQIHANFDGVGDTVFLRVRLRISVWGVIKLGMFIIKEQRQKSQIQKGAIEHGKQASNQ